MKNWWMNWNHVYLFKRIIETKSQKNADKIKNII